MHPMQICFPQRKNLSDLLAQIRRDATISGTSRPTSSASSQNDFPPQLDAYVADELDVDIDDSKSVNVEYEIAGESAEEKEVPEASCEESLLADKLKALVKDGSVDLFEIGSALRIALRENVPIQNAITKFIDRLLLANTKMLFSDALHDLTNAATSNSANWFMNQYLYEKSCRHDTLLRKREEKRIALEFNPSSLKFDPSRVLQKHSIPIFKDKNFCGRQGEDYFIDLRKIRPASSSKVMMQILQFVKGILMTICDPPYLIQRYHYHTTNRVSLDPSCETEQLPREIFVFIQNIVLDCCGLFDPITVSIGRPTAAQRESKFFLDLGHTEDERMTNLQVARANAMHISSVFLPAKVADILRELRKAVFTPLANGSWATSFRDHQAVPKKRRT